MKKIIISLCMFAIAFALQAQDEKLRVAVFDPTSSGTSIDEGTKIAVRELISSTFVNMGKYSIVERSLLDKVMKELAFSNTDVVDDSQATELGRLAGANKVVLSVVTLVGGRNMLSVKVIDVQTATVEQQKTKIVNSNDLLDVVEPLTLELMGEKATYNNATVRQDISSDTQDKAGRKTMEEDMVAKMVEKLKRQDTPSNTDYSYRSTPVDCNNLEMEIVDRNNVWILANNGCPQGWGLPTPEEAVCLCQNQKQLKKSRKPLKSGWYWTNFEIDNSNAYAIKMTNCELFKKPKHDNGITSRCVLR